MSDKRTPSEFGEWLKKARGEARLTQEGLSALCGETPEGRPVVHVNTIKNLESGDTQKPTARVSSVLREVLGNPPTAEGAREGMDRHTQAFLDLVGAYLMRLPMDQRLDRIFELTRIVLTRP